MAHPIDLQDLSAFRAAAKVQSFKRAAELLHLSQPAFSRRIEKLEKTLGLKLLERTTRRVNLTASGRAFERQIAPLLDALESAFLDIRGTSMALDRTVCVACVPSTVNYFLSQVIGKYQAAHPKTRIRILDDSANNVLVHVSRGDAEFGISFMGVPHGELEFTPLLEERFVVICPRGHALSNKRQVKWSDLAGHTYIAVGKNSGNRLLLDQAVAELKRQPVHRLETQHVTTMIGLVEAGLGVAVVPSIAAPSAAHPLLVSVPLREPVITRKVGLVRKKGVALGPAAQTLYEMCLAHRLPFTEMPS